MAKSKKQIDEMNKSLSELNKTTNKVSKSVENLTKVFKNSDNDLFKNVEKDVDDSVESIKDFSKEISNVRRKLDGISSLSKKAFISKGFDGSALVEYGAKIKKLDSLLKKSASSSVKTSGELESLGEEIRETSKEVDELNKSFDEMVKNLETAQSKSSSGVVGDLGEGVGQLKSMLGALYKGNYSDMKKQFKASEEFGNSMKGWATPLSEAKGLMGALGNTAKGLGSVIGGAGKLLSAWPTSLLSVAKVIINIGMAMDKFVKDANKAFATIRGPNIMTSDIKQQFRDFNDQAYNMFDNLKVGLDVNQVREFMASMQQAGLNITTLNEGFYNYRTAVYVASKASKTLSLDLAQVGSMTTDLINNYRMNLGEIDKLFVQVAFDAGKTGISTDKFWSAIMNANASLAFYGVALDRTTKTMERFTKAGVMGVDDTSKTVQDLTQTFSNMNLQQRAAFGGLLRRSSEAKKMVNKMFDDVAKSMAVKEGEIDTEITFQQKEQSKTKEGSKEYAAIGAIIEKAQQKKANVQQKMADAIKAQTLDEVAQAAYLPMISDRAGELISVLVKANLGKNLGDLNGTQIQMAQNLFKSSGINVDLLMSLRALSGQSSKYLQNMMGIDQKSLENNKAADGSLISALDGLTGITKENKDVMKGEMSSHLQAIKKATDNNDPEEIAKAQNDLASWGEKTAGLSGEQAKNLAYLATLNNDLGKELQNIMFDGSSTSKTQLEDLSTLMKSQNVAGAAAFKARAAQNKMQGELEKQAEDTHKQIVDQTLSFEEMKKIAKEDITYRASNLKLLAGISGGISNMVQMMAKQWGEGGKTPDEVAAAASLKEKGYQKGGWAQSSKDRGYVKTAKEEATKSFNLDKKIKAEEPMATGAESLASGIDRAFLKPEGINKGELEALGEIIERSRYTGNVDIVDALTNLRKASEKDDKDAMKKAQDSYKTLMAKGDRSETLDKIVEGLHTETKDQLIVDKKNLVESEEAVRQLKIVSEDAKKMAELQKAIMMGDEGALKTLGEKIKDLKSKNLSKEYIGQSMNLTPDEIEKAVASAGGWDAKMAGLNQPVKVAGAEVKALLHKGETILPTDFAMPKPPPIQNIEIPATPESGGGHGDVSISVNANTKDLAQMIANEVRAVLYREKLTGMA